MDRRITFAKYSGAGNDFIMISNYTEGYKYKYARLARFACPRGSSAGADGIIFIERSRLADIRMRIFNADGSEAEMCGNGARCSAQFAYEKRIAGKKMSIETKAGIHNASILPDAVSVEMIPPKSFKKYTIRYKKEKYNGILTDTGVPHFVIPKWPHGNIREIGRFFREHRTFKPAGTNVDFIRIENKGRIRIRTYERGVEDETLACGTGATACALTAMREGLTGRSVSVETAGGAVLKIKATMDRKGEITGVILTGEARLVYKGVLNARLEDYI